MNPKRDRVTHKARGSFATVAWVEDTTDLKVGAILAEYVLPMRKELDELRAQAALPWWKRLLGRS